MAEGQFVKFFVPYQSAQVEGGTVLEIPCKEIDAESLDNLHAHIEDVFTSLTESEIAKIVLSMIDQNLKAEIMKVMVRYTAKRRSVDGTNRAEVMARYNSEGFEFVDDCDDSAE